MRQEARKAAYLPEDGGGILANAKATVLSKITFSRAPTAKPSVVPKADPAGEAGAEGAESSTSALPQETDQILARAEFWLTRGDLEKVCLCSRGALLTFLSVSVYDKLGDHWLPTVAS